MGFKISSVKNVQDFTTAIESMINEGFDYIDAVVNYCEKNKIEIEVAAALVKLSPKLKTKLKAQARRLNLLKKKRVKE